jgi:prepilin-type N-terminal cleavage/methylation domain-containing protein
MNMQTSRVTSAVSSGRPRRSHRGFTAIEIMLSIAVLGIGAAGVMSMQRASIQGNADARMLDLGTAIARGWVERLRRDAATWTMPDESGGTQNWSSPNTVWIGAIGAAPGTWITPPMQTWSNGSFSGVNSPAADILGRDVQGVGAPVSSYPNAVFCTQLRGDWLVQDQLLRAEVRVYWLRQLFAAPSGSFCAADTPSSANAGQVYHFIYAATAMRRTPGQ